MCPKLRTTSGCSEHCAGAAAVKGDVWREGYPVDKDGAQKRQSRQEDTAPAGRRATALRDTGRADQTQGNGVQPGEHGSICLRLAGWFWRKTKPRGHEAESLT